MGLLDRQKRGTSEESTDEESNRSFFTYIVGIGAMIVGILTLKRLRERRRS